MAHANLGDKWAGKNDRRSTLGGTLSCAGMGSSCPPRSFLRPAESQSPRRDMGRASRQPVNSVGKLGVLAPFWGSLRTKASAKTGNRQPLVRVAAYRLWGRSVTNSRA